MAWIESHQELARHPKTKKLSRRLGISVPAAIGHLHMLWWWALDYAQDGDLSVFEAEDIADAMEWPSESAEVLLNALLESEFIDSGDGLFLHDWFDYAGRLVEQREKNRERKRKSRSVSSNKANGHTPVTRPSRGQVEDNSGGHGATVPNQTIPNHTEPNTSTTTGSEQPLNPFKLFESEGFGTISSIIADRLGDLVDDYGERWVCEAMKAAVVAGKRNLGYVDAILKRYRAEGVDEPWKVEKPAPKKTNSTRPGGKPDIAIVSNANAQPVSADELEELRKLAAKLDGGRPE